MLTKVLLFLIASIPASRLFSQNIDSLRTDEQVLSFVRKLNQDYANLYIRPPKPVFGLKDYDSRIKLFGSVAYEKGDFDNNGFTDLLFNGYLDDYEGNHTCRRMSFVVLSFGKDSFRVKELSQGYFIDFFAAKKTELNGKKYILTINVEGQYSDTSKYFLQTKLDTLAYAYDEFIEKPIHNNYTINKIEYCAFGGLGAFATLKLSITDSISILESQENFQLHQSVMDSGGVFQTRIDPITYNRILGILQDINFPQLKEAYAVRWTDDINGFIKITYDSGKIKKISDYGLTGTYGLAALQKIFIGLKDGQHWTKIRQGNEVLIGCQH